VSLHVPLDAGLGDPPVGPDHHDIELAKLHEAVERRPRNGEAVAGAADPVKSLGTVGSVRLRVVMGSWAHAWPTFPDHSWRL
jgi:hypothetical protein